VKQTDKLNQIWYETSDEVTRIGLTASFLEQLDQCWHILPPSARQIRMKAPLFTVETNDSLVSVLSPVAGNFLNWNDRATNFPDKLRDTDVIIELTSKVIPEPVAPPVTDPQREIDRLRTIERDGTQSVTNRVAAQRQRWDMENQRAQLTPLRQEAPRAVDRVQTATANWEPGLAAMAEQFITTTARPTRIQAGSTFMNAIRGADPFDIEARPFDNNNN
jgi:hypothetical protein